MDLLIKLSHLARRNIKRYFDEHGNHIPIHKLSDADAELIASYEIILKNAKAGDGVTDTVLKMKFDNRTAALELLARHHKLLGDLNAVTVDDDAVIAILNRAKARVAAHKGAGSKIGTRAPQPASAKD